MTFSPGPFYHSMRGKIVLASAVVGLFLIIISSASYIYINRSSTEVARVLEQRLKKLNQTRLIMDNIWDASFYLQEHSIAPNNEARDLIFTKMVSAVDQLLHLIDQEKHDEQSVVKLHHVLDSLGQLGTYISQLLSLRGEPAKLFPAIEVSRSSMFQSQRSFAHLISLSLEEALLSADGTNTDILAQLIDLQYQWVQMISSYRMYLVNRLALMDEEILDRQAQNVDVYVKNIEHALNRFASPEYIDRLGFQLFESLAQLKQSAEIWASSFHKIISTDTAAEWRTDYPVIKEKIAPIMKAMWESLLDYNHDLENDLKLSTTELSMVATRISYLLWAVTGIGLIVIVVLFYFIDRALLRPVHAISVAMREEAADGEYLKPIEIEGTSLETENLVDAFSMMQLQVHNRKRELEHQALHDSLTGLPNRLLLFDRLEQAIAKQKRQHGSLALIMMDLNRFKEINDTLGHQAGDELLKQVSRRLKDCLRDADTVARLGGDEFAILIPDCDPTLSKKIARKIRECMLSALMINDQSLYIHGSLGIANYPEHGEDAETLLKNADIAMYVAKRNNSVFEIYDLKQDQHSVDRLALKHELQKAINAGKLMLFYQPQVFCKSGRVESVEALVRWQNSEAQFISPEVFIPLAEESGLIKQLTEWVVEEAIYQQQEWLLENINVQVSVNLSAWNLLDPELDRLIARAFEKYNIRQNRISFEITESVMMTDTEQALCMMQRLNQLGSPLIVDDYGTGFSSLAYLKKFPVRELKIDKSFVLNMIDNENDAIIVKSTIDLAHNLGLKVCAEGVETKDVMDVLQVIGCDKMQGYYILPPAPADKFVSWYRQTLTQLAG